jgi:hypothetical protein
VDPRCLKVYESRKKRAGKVFCKVVGSNRHIQVSQVNLKNYPVSRRLGKVAYHVDLMPTSYGLAPRIHTWPAVFSAEMARRKFTCAFPLLAPTTRAGQSA